MLSFVLLEQDGEKPTWDDEFGGEEGYAYGMEDGEGGEEGADGMEGGEGMDWGDGMEEEDEDAPINMVRRVSPSRPSFCPQN